MFESIKFENFKTLRDTTLPLSPFTLIVGPNGSGKSTALSAFSFLRNPDQPQFFESGSVGMPIQARVALTAKWKEADGDVDVQVEWQIDRGLKGITFEPSLQTAQAKNALRALVRARIYSLDPTWIPRSIQISRDMDFEPNGAGLPIVLDRLRDNSPERFEALNEQLGQWLPEFNRILFDTPSVGQCPISLRTRQGDHAINAGDLSHGTLIALALLTLAYMPNPPSIICLEEPDRGLHPRLLRDVRDALYRLAFPDGAREKRDPVQVIATTHNPFFLDLFREHPEQIVIAEKTGLESKFSRLSDRADLEEILGDAPLSEVWYSGVLGGVPAGT